MLTGDRMLSLVVAIETALEDKRFEASASGPSPLLHVGIARRGRVSSHTALLGYLCGNGLSAVNTL